jgi:two-component system phosphate regulon response regulator PhoB
MAGKILIVEDDRELQELYAAMLEDSDYQITQAYDGEEGWEKLQEMTPDLILLDIILDEMMGDTLFARIKQTPRHRDVPVIVVSVLSASSRQCRHLLEIDPNTAFLRKPFQKAQLLDMVANGLAHGRAKE